MTQLCNFIAQFPTRDLVLFLCIQV